MLKTAPINVLKWLTVERTNFALSDKKLKETKNSLIKQAMQDARAKADIVASAAGMKVVGIKSINLNELAIQPPPPDQPLLCQDRKRSLPI
jgi:uncharacterized protein YggE